MNIDHYTNREVALAAALVNSEPATPEELRRLLVEHRLSGLGAVEAADLAAVRALRPRLRAIFAADTPADAAAEINTLLREAGSLPQLTNHDGEEWHLHYTPMSARLSQRLAAEAAMGLAVVMRDDGLERFKTCAASTCSDVFVDTSRNRSRRYCDPDTCGNRANVAAYRARQRAVAQSA